MSGQTQRRVPILLALAVGALAIVGCGDSGNEEADLQPWPVFGRVPERTHYLPAPPRRSLDPPLREAWSINTHALIEFPPAVAGGVAFVVNKYGNSKAVRLSDRRVIWERNPNPKDSGTPTDVTAPVYHQGKVFFADVDGDLQALDATTGKRIWARSLPGHLESSPMAVDGSLYLGTDEAKVLALDAGSGKLVWRFDAPGAIKASPSVHDGRVFVADYESGMYSLDADSGKLVWRTNTSKVPPFGQGGFYSSPAIAFGHAYAARDDGTVYAFDEDSGKVAWTFQTGNFIYGSPVAAQIPGTPPSIYIGGYDERFYALGAGDGKVRWRYDVGGAVPGTATAIGHTVYVSSFKTDKTIGIDARSHRKTFEIDQAGYTPMVSDGRRLYLIGYYELIGLEPRRG